MTTKKVARSATTGRLVTVSRVEKRAAELRIKVDKKRGATTSKTISSVANAQRQG